MILSENSAKTVATKGEVEGEAAEGEAAEGEEERRSRPVSEEDEDAAAS